MLTSMSARQLLIPHLRSGIIRRVVQNLLSSDVWFSGLLAMWSPLVVWLVVCWQHGTHTSGRVACNLAAWSSGTLSGCSLRHMVLGNGCCAVLWCKTIECAHQGQQASAWRFIRGWDDRCLFVAAYMPNATQLRCS